MSNKNQKLSRVIPILAFSAVLAACGDGPSLTTFDEPEVPVAPATQSFDVTVANLTVGQPFSPVAMIVHDGDYRAFEIGAAASDGLELIAEGGDNSLLISEAEAQDTVILTMSDDAPTGPGASSSTFTMELEESVLEGATATLTTMLVNTNDAFTLGSLSLEGLEVGDTRTATAIVYDSGTEANTEAMGTMPGPADGGEGFNEVRDDIADEVRMHAGVITSDDVLESSRLLEVHRFLNPAMRVSVVRTQ